LIVSCQRTNAPIIERECSLAESRPPFSKFFWPRGANRNLPLAGFDVGKENEVNRKRGQNDSLSPKIVLTGSVENSRLIAKHSYRQHP
jgi:hypothetical protein